MRLSKTEAKARYQERRWKEKGEGKKVGVKRKEGGWRERETDFVISEVTVVSALLSRSSSTYSLFYELFNLFPPVFLLNPDLQGPVPSRQKRGKERS